MSATLPDDSPFTTVMGVDFKEDMRVITPEKANDIGERLIVVPKLINKELNEMEMRNALIEKAKEYNVVVLVPSFAMSKYWESNGGVVLSSENISEGVSHIKENSHGLYVIVNKYDGVTSFTLLSALKHMLSSSPQSFAILSNVPSASIS